MSIETGPDIQLSAQIEALLFVAGEPVSVAELASTLRVNAASVESGLAELEAALSTRGLRLQWHGGRLQLTTAPAFADVVERFLGLEGRTHLTRAALETLAIIAYRQPITRPQIDAIRGVNSDSMLKSLLFKGLVLELGRGPGLGRPILYATTPEFMQHLGLGSISELPPVEAAEAEASHDELLKG